jgi:hypothetical protein
MHGSPAEAGQACESRASPGSSLSGPAAARRRLLSAGALLPPLALLAACSPRLNWREERLPQARCVISLPDRPQTSERDIDFDGGKLSMTMTSTGVGATLFALGVATLPPAAVTPERVEATLGWFRDALLRNVQGTQPATRAVRLATPPGRKLLAAQAVDAQARIAERRGVRSGRLAARFYVVDDRLYQVVALGADGELDAGALETFFDSFRLTD